MSTMINLAPMIAKVVRDMADEQNSILDVETVYQRLNEVYGDELYTSARMLAEIAIRQKIKTHLKSAFSINGEGESDQLRLLKDDAPAALAVKQPGGGYAYVPLRLAGLKDLDSATKAKKDNIKHASAALKRWERSIKPIRAVMREQDVTFGEAQRLLAEQPAADEKKMRKAK